MSEEVPKEFEVCSDRLRRQILISDITLSLKKCETEIQLLINKLIPETGTEHKDFDLFTLAENLENLILGFRITMHRTRTHCWERQF